MVDVETHCSEPARAEVWPELSCLTGVGEVALAALRLNQQCRSGKHLLLCTYIVGNVVYFWDYISL